MKATFFLIVYEFFVAPLYSEPPEARGPRFIEPPEPPVSTPLWIGYILVSLIFFRNFFANVVVHLNSFYRVSAES